MRYLAMIYEDESNRPQSPEEMDAVMAKYMAYNKELTDAGAMLAGEALQGSETATQVRMRSGETLVSDGPFSETKEVIGGFYMFEAENLDKAIEWAAKIPAAETGIIEVRPIWELGE